MISSTNTKKLTEGAKGLFATIKEGFRTNTKNLSEVLLDKMHNPTPRSELFPYRLYNKKESLYYLEGNIAGFTFSCDAIVGIEDSIYKQISMLFDDQLPYGGVIEVLLLASDDIEEQTQKWKQGQSQEDAVFAKFRKYRTSYIDEFNKREDVNFKHRDYKLFVSYANNLDKKKGAENILKFKDRLKIMIAGLGCNPRLLKPEGFISLTKELINYPDYKNVSYSEYDSISDQIVDTANSLLVDSGGVMNKWGEYLTRVYEVTNLPKGDAGNNEEDGWSINQMVSLLGDNESDYMQIPSRFAICYSISNELKESNQEAYRKKGEMLINQPSYLEKFNRVLAEETKEWSYILQNNLKNRERFLRSSFFVMVTSKANKIDYTESALMSLWRKRDFVIKPLNNFHLPGLLSFCPYLNKTDLGQLLKTFKLKKTVLSSEPKALMPIHAEWKGSSNGGMLLTGRLGQLFSWNNYEGANNYNACVIGETGSGKSVFLQEFVFNHLARGTRVFVVEIGRSFAKLANINGGDHIEFGEGSQVCLNPFVGIPEGEAYNPKVEHDENKPQIGQDSLNYVKKIVQKMAAPIHGTSDLQNASLSRAISRVWKEHKKKTSIDKIIEELEAGDQNDRDLAKQLFDFGSQGNYGRFFTGENPVKFDKQLTVMEFDDLREFPELGGVIMQMLAVQIVQQVYSGDRSQKFIILIDEAWYALENFPFFLASMAKTVRKYNGALVLGTQSFEHFYGDGESSGGLAETARRSVAQSCGWKLMLKQSPESCDALTKMRVASGIINNISKLETVKGEYSEILIYESNKQYFISRLMLDRYAQVLYSSTPEVYSKVEKYKKQGMDTGSAVEQVMKEIYPEVR
jgi:conjugal transfer ATP-binding protein TraC